MTISWVGSSLMVDATEQRLGTRIVVAGGGVAGWIAAAGLGCAFGSSREITVVGHPVDDPPAMLAEPGFNTWLGILGLSARDLIRATSATFSLGVEVSEAGGADAPVFIPFDGWAAPVHGIDLHHYWVARRDAGRLPPLRDFMLSAQAAERGRVVIGSEPALVLFPRGYHVATEGLAGLMRSRAEANGVRHLPGSIADVRRDGLGRITALVLADGQVVEGDFFIDATDDGQLAAAIGGQRLGDADALDGQSEWSRSEPAGPIPACTQIVVADDMIRQRFVVRPGRGTSVCFTRTTRRDAGSWCLDKDWMENCVAVGRAAGAIPASPGASLSAIEAAMAHLLQLFPQSSTSPLEREEFNRRMSRWHERTAAFAELVASAKPGQPLRSAALHRQVALFVSSGRLPNVDDDPVPPSVWAAALIQKGFIPGMPHPMVSGYLTAQVDAYLADLPHRTRAIAESMPDQLGVVDGA